MPIGRPGEINVKLPEDRFFQDTRLLAEEVRDTYAGLELELPILVFLGSGGMIMSGIMRRHLGIKRSRTLQVAVERKDDGIAPVKFKARQLPESKLVHGKNLLAVDAVWRTGATLRFAMAKLKKLGAESVMSAVIYDTIPPGRTEDDDILRPDYHQVPAHNMGNIIFPWEWDEHPVIKEFDARQKALDSGQVQAEDVNPQYL